MKLELRVVDAGGLGTTVHLTPWTVAIPHEEVNFATDSALIEEAERPKLDAALARIAAEVEKAKKLSVKCSLFVAGHTDTVGTREHNLKLSVDRAQSIASYFRKRGLGVPIAYEGFGEERPKVKTPDETDERANRRADYVLSADPPSSLGPVVRWKDVK
jgi:outer membrane protein OmpA-like peptidoglycan-associated protein